MQAQQSRNMDNGYTNGYARMNGESEARQYAQGEPNGQTMLGGYRQDIMNGFEAETPRYNPVRKHSFAPRRFADKDSQIHQNRKAHHFSTSVTISKSICLSKQRLATARNTRSFPKTKSTT